MDVGKYETCAKFNQKSLNSMVVGTCQSFFNFSDKIPNYFHISRIFNVLPNFPFTTSEMIRD